MNCIVQSTPKKVESLSLEFVIDVQCNEFTTAIITSNGLIFTFGCALDGLTGHGTISSTIDVPRALFDLTSKKVMSVSVGYFHSACITYIGEVYTWGDGCDGKLGHGDKFSHRTPKCVDALSVLGVKLISCGRKHTAVCTKDGSVYTFGRGEEGQLGQGGNIECIMEPRIVLALKNIPITQIQCGSSHTMALTLTGYLYTWGFGLHAKTCFRGATSGQLGHGETSNFLTLPCLVENLREHNIIQIATKYDSCAVIVDDSRPNALRRKHQDILRRMDITSWRIMNRSTHVTAQSSTIRKSGSYQQ